MKTIAIMQPSFLPWLGYFHLIDMVDEFVFLDNVQFDKRSWQQRNQIKTSSGAQWLTVPVETKGRADQKIIDVRIAYNGDKSPLHKIVQTIEQNYASAKYYSSHGVKILEILEREHKLLHQLNISLIKKICDILGIPIKFKYASELKSTGSKERLLINICKEISADKYISPIGSKAYLDKTELFKNEGIILEYMTYEHPIYYQKYGKFLPYMSIIDLICNEGHNSMNIVNNGK